MSPIAAIYRGLPLDECSEVSWPIMCCHVGVFDWRRLMNKVEKRKGAGVGNLRSGFVGQKGGKNGYGLPRVEKCVLVLYSSFKKRYKSFSLERKQFFISKDVNFFENVLPFKIKLSSKVNKSSYGLDHVNFFDEIVHEGLDTPNDDNNLNAQPQNKGNNSSQSSSPTIDLVEDELGHP
ncbi:hypothetical protein Tco_1409403 [Tanacetum coccineum]